MGNYNAASLLADGSDKQYRLNLTWAAQFYPRQLIKMSIEHLAQKMKFDFDTRDERTWVGQNAYGIEYKFLRPQQLLNDVDIKWYYSQAESKDLNSITYFQDGAEWRNDRHIAGGRAQGGSAGVHLLPTKHTLIGTAVNYSEVNYDSRYNTKDHDSRGIGGSLSLEQLLSKQIKVHFIASDMVPLQHYEAGIDYSPVTGIGKHLNVALAFARDIGDSGLPDDSQTTLRLSYVWQDQPVIADESATQLPGVTFHPK
ncbi:MAG: hypothetical protein GY821_13445 [Gammaproteobacteria bacterium]|nr:hypothetical protein [Gammaproteobacteria bacterium]